MRMGLTFDDVCLVPQYNNVVSRGDPVLKTWLTSNIETELPLIPSNMNTVIGHELAGALQPHGGDVIDHRFHTYDSLHPEIAAEHLASRVYKFGRPICISWGLQDKATLDALLKWGTDSHIWGVCFDVAHGHCEGMFEIMDWTRANYPDVEIIAGNVCTQLGYQELVSHGATAVKVGVGCGAACTTRMVTGFGLPQFTAIRDCAELAKKLRVPIIADGGIRNSRDIILALAAGASTVMMGKMFAACTESAAEKYELRTAPVYSQFADISARGNQPYDPPRYRAKYRGQASFDFQQEFYGKVRHAPEGESMWIPVSGPVDTMIDQLTKQIKAGLTYAGATSIAELQRKAEFIQVTHNYFKESGIRPL